MKKKFRITITLLLLMVLLIPSMSFASSITEERLLPRLVDDAFLLTDEENTKLLKKLDEISERQKLDIAIVTVNSLEGHTATEFADDFYDYNGYGMGEGYDGILLLISMGDRDWAISKFGFGITAFTDAGLNRMTGQFIPYLSNGDFYKAFETFANLSDDYITEARAGKPYDVSNLPKKPPSPLLIPISLVIGAIISLILTGIMKGQLKSVSMQRTATSYVRQNSLNLIGSKDIYLYNVVSKRARPKESKSSSGGSTTHKSSSGRSHGGSSGKF